MSHIHHLGGYSQAAGQYQEYLGSLKAARLARRGQLTESEASDETLTFDSPIDPDGEPDEQGQDDGETQAEEAQAEETQAEAPQDEAPAPEASTGLNEQA